MTPSPPTLRWRRGVEVLRRHRGIAVLLAAAALLRVAVLVAYPPAFWFSDTTDYLQMAESRTPGLWHGFGYSVVLIVFRHIGVLPLAVVQHGIGLAVAAGCYALAVHRGAPSWLGVLAAAPVALDGEELTVEHYLLSDVWFVGLVAAAAILLFWRHWPGPLTAASAGLLLVAAAVVRPVGLPLLVLAAGYLLVRWVGWRTLAAFVVAVALPMGGYLSWYHRLYGEYGLTATSGRYLYARVAGFADCRRLRLTPRVRRLCPAQPIGRRPARPDAYLWTAAAPQVPDATDADYRSFALAVLRAQPGGYARMLVRDSARFVEPYPERAGSEECLYRYWRLPADPAATMPPFPVSQPGGLHGCQPWPAAHGFGLLPATTGVPRRTVLTRALHAYSGQAVTPGPLLGLGLLLGLSGLLVRPRREDTDGSPADSGPTPLLAPPRRSGADGLRWRWRPDPAGRDGAALALAGLALLVAAAGTSMYDARYGLPALPLAAVAGVLGRHGRWRRAAPPVPLSPDRSGDDEHRALTAVH